MFNFARKTLCVGASVACLTFFSVSAQAAPDNGLIINKPVEGTCSVGNFSGWVKALAVLRAVGDYQEWTVTLHQYRITKSNGQKGGNKANLDLFIVEAGNNSAETKSPDSMKQDGQLNFTDVSATVRATQGVAPSVLLRAIFTFDKAGPDPWCDLRFHVPN